MAYSLVKQGEKKCIKKYFSPRKEGAFEALLTHGNKMFISLGYSAFTAQKKTMFDKPDAPVDLPPLGEQASAAREGGRINVISVYF